MNGLSDRALWAWIIRATSSLPVPLSPSISTVTSLRATSSAMRITLRIASLSPTSKLGSERLRSR